MNGNGMSIGSDIQQALLFMWFMSTNEGAVLWRQRRKADVERISQVQLSFIRWKAELQTTRGGPLNANHKRRKYSSWLGESTEPWHSHP